MIGYLVSVRLYRRTVANISFVHTDASGIKDGIYIGEFDVKFIYAKVKVSVSDGRITKIELLEHKNDRGGAAEAIIEEIIAMQKIDVDAVSGATNSSQIIKKAVDNALSGEPLK